MNLDIIDVFVAYTTSDEYGTPNQIIGVYGDKTEARKNAKGKGFCGGDGAVHPRKSLMVNENPCRTYLLDEKCYCEVQIGKNLIQAKEEKKTRALSKLTDEEKELLGVTR